MDKFILERSKQIGKHTLNKEISNLRAFLNWGKKARYFGQDINVHKVKAENREIQPLSTRQIRNLLMAARPYPTWHMRILLSLTTGLRKNDVESLRIRDIDIETSAINTRSKKTKKRMLNRPLPPKVVSHLAEYIEYPSAGQIDLFPDTHTFKKRKKIRTQAGLPNLRYQDLRVTFSTTLAEAGESTSVRQRLLEHSSPQITEDYYTKVREPVLFAIPDQPTELAVFGAFIQLTQLSQVGFFQSIHGGYLLCTICSQVRDMLLSHFPSTYRGNSISYCSLASSLPRCPCWPWPCASCSPRAIRRLARGSSFRPRPPWPATWRGASSASPWLATA